MIIIKEKILAYLALQEEAKEKELEKSARFTGLIKESN